MKLNEKAENSYSERNKKLFTIITSNGKINSVDIVKKFYGRSPIPLNGQKIIFGDINSLRRKIDANREPFKIASTKRAGHIPMTFWVEKR